MQPFIQKYETIIIRIIVVLGILLSLFLLAAMLGKFKEYRFIGSGLPAGQTITVTGKGDLNKAPDTAKINFSIRADASQVKTAQKSVSDKITSITKALRDLGIEERYIKTDSYNSYPKYVYSSASCVAIGCPRPGTPRVVGYEVTHAITVMIKDLDKVSSVLDALGSAGVNDLNGPNFGFEDDKAVAREAREFAIKDARQQAEALAKSLGVKLVRLAAFSEQGNYPYLQYRDTALETKAGSAVSNPAIPVGEQEITSIVTLTYEIR